MIRIISSSARPRLGILSPLLRQIGASVRIEHYSRAARLEPEIPVMILGGTQSICGSLDRPMLDFMKGLERHMGRGGKSIGLCLGAQIQAKILGSRVREHPFGTREIGYHLMNATCAHRSADLPQGQYFAWHYDIIEPCRALTITMSNDASEVQAFRHGDTTYGFQFHPEADLRMILRWQQLGAHRLMDPGAQDACAQLAIHAKVHLRNRRAFSGFLRKTLSLRSGNRMDASRPA